jgi:tRNA threonylcarbamoyladenosine biosynthesis protein TsaB
MKLLALDTSSVACTVAVQVGTDVFAQHVERAREHTQLLMPMIRQVLDEASVSLSELDAIVLGNGPGSFIGMRIAASVAQGLAHGSGCKIIPVSSLAAVAANVFASTDATQVVVAQDAHMKEVYLGVFDRNEAGHPERSGSFGPERLHGQDVIAELTEAGADRRIAAGFGWEGYPELMALNNSRIAIVSGIHYPRAEYLLALAPTSDALDPQHIEPAYLREKVAKKPAASGF